MAYAIYLRKSRADAEMEALGEMETLARHEKILTELAKRQELPIGRIYKEIVSGESIADRPQMKQLLDDVYLKKWEGVLVMEVERLARGDTRDQGDVAEAFKYSNTKIITPIKTYDPNNEYDEEYFEFGLFMSRREYKTIKRRLDRGRKISVQEGNYIGGCAPYGYDIWRRGKKDITLKPNEDAKIVKMIYEWYANDNLGASKIASKLSLMGVTSPSGNKEWNHSCIIDILKNPHYIGKIRWKNREMKKEFVDGKMKKMNVRNKVNFEIYDGKHEAIIDEELYERVQNRIGKNSKTQISRELQNPLAGILCCKSCGKKLVYQGYSTRPNMSPRYVHVHSVFCKMKSSSAKEVIDAVIIGLKAHIEDFELKMTNEFEIENKKKQDDVIEFIEKELIKLKKSRTKLFDYLEDGIYTKEEFVERKGILTVKIEELEKQLEAEKLKVGEEVNYEEKIVTLKQIIESLKDDSIGAKYKNDFLKEVIDHIDYECEDFGRGRGGQIYLDIFLK